MSYILDALRKSESERQRDASVSLSRVPLAAVRQRIPIWTWILIGILSLALVALATTSWRDGDDGAGAVAGNTPPVEPTAEPPPDTALTPPPSATIDGPDTPSAAPASAAAADSPPVLRPASELARADPTLPAFQLEVLAHNSRNPAAGYAWINGTRYDVGDRIGRGPELVEVRADGVVLAYGGERYLLTTR
jgi:general secretion pathway protein B